MHSGVTPVKGQEGKRIILEIVAKPLYSGG